MQVSSSGQSGLELWSWLCSEVERDTHRQPRCLIISGTLLTPNVIDLVAASLLVVEKNTSHILGTSSLAVDVDNV